MVSQYAKSFDTDFQKFVVCQRNDSEKNVMEQELLEEFPEL